MFGLWELLHATTLLASTGFSPFAIPLALFFACSFPQEWWAAFTAKYSQFTVITVILPTIAVVTYWVNGALLLVLDLWVRPEVMEPFKIQKGKRFCQQLLPKVCLNILGGQLVIFAYAFCLGLLAERSSVFTLRHERLLPSGRERVLHLAGILFFNEITFFYGHWLMHQKFGRFNLYAMIHKKHHEFTSPVGLVASYCHPVEMLVSNVFPLTFGAAVLRAHTYSSIVWVGFAVLGTQFHHSGYRLPWVCGIEHQPNFHDFHHEKFNGNYGNLGFLDMLHSTNKEWQKHLKENGAHKERTLGWFILRAWTVGVAGSSLISHFAGESR